MDNYRARNQDKSYAAGSVVRPGTELDITSGELAGTAHRKAAIAHEQ